MTGSQARRLLSEFIGSAFLVAAVVGSGIAASRLFPSQTGLELLTNSVVTGAALVALILALQPVSAAFNPVVTMVERLLGLISTSDALAQVTAQVAGAITGCIIANLMFGLQAITISTHRRAGGPVYLSEVVATLGLVIVIFAAVRSGQKQAVAYAVGAYIMAAYWFTGSTSFANPAVTIARMFSDTFAGISPSSVPLFILMQLVGGLLAWALISALYPRRSGRTPAAADEHAEKGELQG
jgi:glycerol uptake facilitator-like aquaporin